MIYLTVTPTTLTAHRPGLPLELLDPIEDYFLRLGIADALPTDALPHPRGVPVPLWPIVDGPQIIRDVENRGISYLYVNDHGEARRVEECVSRGWLQLEAAPPPWPDAFRLVLPGVAGGH